MSEVIVESSEHYYLSLLPQDMVKSLRRRYAERQRKYHVWKHVQEMFLGLEEIDDCVSCLPAMVLATVFHDAVYDPQRNDNELKSSALMRKMWRKSMDPYWAERAETFIHATIDHKLPEGADSTSDEAYFLDMDMAILGLGPARYMEYAKQIRAEYCHVPDQEYRVGRTRVLSEFYERPELYYTAWGARRFEELARKNILWELGELNGRILL